VVQGLPDAALWPAARHERPLKLLVISDKNSSLATYRRIARRLGSQVEYVYVGVNDQVEYHVNDKWIEPKDNPTVVRWQKRWLAELSAGEVHASPVPSPSLEKLMQWWTGREAITPALRTVTWFGDNQRELTLSWDPKQPLGEAFLLAVPPTGEIQGVKFALSASAPAQVRFDLGCDGSRRRRR
jgi:hypothetical protein